MTFDDDYKDEITKYRELVNKQAAEVGGWINLTTRYGNEVVAIVPKHPFYRWALREAPINLDKLYPWHNVSPHSFKLQNDCIDHTDWMMGGKCSFENYYSFDDEDNTNSIQRVAYRQKRRIQREELCFEKMVLCNGGIVSGRIKHVLSLNSFLEEKKPYENSNLSCSNPDMVLDGDIIVIPNAGVDFELAFLEATKSGAGGVICVIPNKVAHLCKVARERNVTIMCDPDAFEVYKDTWWEVTLNPHRGTIEVVRK